jgi:formate dehydrogenase major subunit
VLDLTWDYPRVGPLQEPSGDAVLREINGWGPDGKPLGTFADLKDDGSTTCGCWIYCGVYKDGVNQAARRKPGSEQNLYALEWAWAWPLNRRIMYNRASADPDGKPWSERKKLVWWDAAKSTWTGDDVPDFELKKAPDYKPPEGARAQAAIPGNRPFTLQADGFGWLFAPTGLVDGPMPTHYEPQESPFPNLLYGQRSNPTRQQFDEEENRYNPADSMPGSDAFPFVATTYRLTEHHTAGGMSRFIAHLAELQPEFFCEVSPELAAERGLEHGGWATIITARTAVEARVMVTDRVAPLIVNGRVTHVVGMPYHWGYDGLSTGDSANDLFSIVLDPNVHIQEVKATSCDIRPGRRPRGGALRKLVDSYPALSKEPR